MNKLTRAIALVMVILSVIGVVPSYAGAAFKVPTVTSELTLDGTVSVIAMPEDYWYKHNGEAKRDYTPTLVKEQDGEYTLTIYEGTEVTLDGNYQKGLYVGSKSLGNGTGIGRYVALTPTRLEGNLNISSGITEYATDGLGKLKETLKERVEISYREYDFNKSEYVYFGKPIILNIVINPTPTREEELIKILKVNGYEEGMTDIEKFWVVYSWITRNVEYSSGDAWHMNSISPALKYGLTKCSGYAGLFQAMAEAIGLKSEQINGGDHAWNLVNMDGRWYEIDPTNDTGTRWAYNKALKGLGDRENAPVYVDLRAKGIEVSKVDYVWKKDTMKRLYEIYLDTLKRDFEKDRELTKLSREEWAAKAFLYTQEDIGYTNEEWNDLLDEQYPLRKELSAKGYDEWNKEFGVIDFEHFLSAFKSWDNTVDY